MLYPPPPPPPCESNTKVPKFDGNDTSCSDKGRGKLACAGGGGGAGRGPLSRTPPLLGSCDGDPQRADGDPRRADKGRLEGGGS